MYKQRYTRWLRVQQQQCRAFVSCWVRISRSSFCESRVNTKHTLCLAAAVHAAVFTFAVVYNSSNAWRLNRVDAAFTKIITTEPHPFTHRVGDNYVGLFSAMGQGSWTGAFVSRTSF